MKRALLLASLLVSLATVHAAPQTTAFTYQGSLTANGAPSSGPVDLSFKLFDAATGGTQIGSTIAAPAFPVVNGKFAIDLDFPTAFAGQQRWVEVTVGGQVLLPRQPVNAVPVAKFALSVGSPNTVVVSAGADALVNGSDLLTALSTVAAQSPSATNTFLIKLGPGIYDIGATPAQLLAYVDVEGSGQGTTQIIGNGQASATSGVILGASNAQLRELSVQSRTGNTYSTAIYASATNLSLARVTVRSAGGSANGTGIYNNGGSPLIDNVTVLASNTTTNGLSFGISNDGGAAQIKNSSIQAQTTGTGQSIGIANTTGATTLISAVQINASSSGAPNGVSPDAQGITSNASSPLIQQSSISVRASGGGSGVGVVLNNAGTLGVTATIENSSITVTDDGAAFTQGILNNTAGGNPVTAIVRNSSITVYAGTKANCQAFAVNSFGAPTQLYNTNINISVGAGCLAALGLILQGGPNDMQFNNGLIKSTQYAVYNNSTAKIRVGASQLSAPTTTAGSGTTVCAASYKGDYTATTAACN